MGPVVWLSFSVVAYPLLDIQVLHMSPPCLYWRTICLGIMRRPGQPMHAISHDPMHDSSAPAWHVGPAFQGETLTQLIPRPTRSCGVGARGSWDRRYDQQAFPVHVQLSFKYLPTLPMRGHSFIRSLPSTPQPPDRSDRERVSGRLPLPFHPRSDDRGGRWPAAKPLMVRICYARSRRRKQLHCELRESKSRRLVQLPVRQIVQGHAMGVGYAV